MKKGHMKTMVENLKEGRPEFNVLRRRMHQRSWRVDENL